MATKVESHSVLPFVSNPRSTPWFDAPRVVPFLTREQFAIRASAEPTPKPPPDFRLCFSTVTERRGVHPLWRIFSMFSRLFGGFFRVVRPVMSVYLLVVTTIAVPFALIAGLWWLAAYCAFIGIAFARLLLEDVRGWRKARALVGRVSEEDTAGADRRSSV